MTNLNWKFSIEKLRKTFKFERLEVINYFGAQAYSTPYLQNSELLNLHPGVLNPHAARVIIGPGLVTIYRAISQINGDQPQLISPADVLSMEVKLAV